MDKDNFLLEEEADRRFMSSIHGNISAAHDYDIAIHDHFFDDHDPQPQDAADEERRIFWESQQFLLQEILDQYELSGTKLREQMKRQIEIARKSSFCNCVEDVKNLIRGCCIKCLRRAAVNQLCTKAFTAALCTSNWKRTHKTPGGTHEYIEVIINASTQLGRKKEMRRLVVELGLWDEFRMGKACDEYNKLINQLPQLYIGKYEHLNAIIRVVCEAAKKSAEEQKIHMGPWRKRSFMQMKWSGADHHRSSSFVDHDHSSNQLWITTSSSCCQPTTVKVA